MSPRSDISNPDDIIYDLKSIIIHIFGVHMLGSNSTVKYARGLFVACVALSSLTGCGSPDESAPGSAASVPGVAANVIQGDSLVVPPVVAAFPDEDYKADLKFKDPVGTSLTVKAGSETTYQIEVTNKGNSTFPAFVANQSAGMVNLTCRTYIAGAAKQPAGGCNRTILEHDLKPGQSVTLPLLVPAPGKPGSYEVHIELVHEGLIWFEDKGSPSLILKYQVK